MLRGLYKVFMQHPVSLDLKSNNITNRTEFTEIPNREKRIQGIVQDINKVNSNIIELRADQSNRNVRIVNLEVSQVTTNTQLDALQADQDSRKIRLAAMQTQQDETNAEVKLLIAARNDRDSKAQQPKPFDWQYYGLIALGVLILVAILVVGVALIIIFI